MELIDKLSILIGRQDKESLLEVLIEEAEAEFKDYCNRSDIPETAESVLCQMVLVKYNRNGSEGLSSESFSGANNSFIDGYPANIVKSLNRYRKVKLV